MWRIIPLVIMLLSSRANATLEYSLAENPYALDDQKACGTLCVGFLDRYFGGSHSYKEIAELCPPGALGVSFEQVEEALNDLGYHTRAVHLTTETLKVLRRPCILYEEDAEGLGHFLVCIRWQPDRETFQVFDPPTIVENLTSKELGHRMSGLALVVSREPIPPIEQLTSDGPSWQQLAGIELVVIGLLICVIGQLRVRTKSTSSKKIATGISLLVCAAVLPSCTSQDQTGQDVSTDSRIINLGKVFQGEDLTATFTIQNVSGSPFRIERVERSCQCQNVKFDASLKILPGDETTVSVVVPTKESLGPVEQQFVVHTTAPDKKHASIELTLLADVHVILRAVPSSVMFGSVSSDAESGQMIRVEADPPELAEKFVSVSAPEFLKVNLVEKNRAGLLFDVDLSPESRKGVLRGHITMQFDIPECPELKIPVYARKIGQFHVIPSTAIFKDTPENQSQKIRVISTDGQVFRLISTLTPAGVTPIWKGNRPEAHHYIDILCTSPAAVNGKSITIKTDHPRESEFTIPIQVVGMSRADAKASNHVHVSEETDSMPASR